MLLEEHLLTAFTIGFLGSIHCIGMCGGIVGALTLSTVNQSNSTNRPWLYLTAYNAGRIVSYTLAGFIAGLLSSTILDSIDKNISFFLARIVTSMFMLALGLYLAGWTQFLLQLESAGSRLWKYIQPLGKRLIPNQSLPQAFLAGMVWGWLPCGLVYSALILALASGDGLTGAAGMLVFGTGTLPALFVSGLTAMKFSNLRKNIWIRRTVGAIFIALAWHNLQGIAL